MVCIRPRDGSPRWALMSVRLTAYGFPPDSCRILARTTGSHDAAWPSIARTRSTSPDQRVTPPPTPPPAVISDPRFCRTALATAAFTMWLISPAGDAGTGHEPPGGEPGNTH